MLQKIFLLLAYFLVLPMGFGQSEIRNSFLQWGEIKIPISELTNGSNGRIKLTLTEVLNSANQPMILMKNGVDIGLQDFFIIVTKQKSKGSPKFSHIKDYDKKEAINLHGKAFLIEHLQEGEFIYLRNLRGKNGVEHFLTIEISYNDPPTSLGFDLPKIPGGESYGFQIVDFANV